MTSDPQPGFRTGVVALVGRTNVGKSSLLNALVHHKVSIVSPRPQTTRHVIQGVIHCPNGQLILADTPGFFQTHRSQLVDRLHARARAALDGVDAIVHVADPSRPIGKEDAMVLETLATTSQARILCLNKLDLRDRPHRAEWMARSTDYTDVLEVSAIARRNLDLLIGRLLPLLPEGPPLYGKEEITNARRDFRITEIIREHIYLLTSEEVPYRTAVRLEGIDERPGKEGRSMMRVRATILVIQDRYKAMLIGAGGRMVRNIGTGARTEIQRLLNAPIFLDLSVRVDPRLGSSPDL